MRPFRRPLFVVWLFSFAACLAAPEPAWPVAGEVDGRVLVREGGGVYRGRASAGMELRAGEIVLTGPDARVEWRVGDEGRWRVGATAVWVAGETPGCSELRAGTALAAVPRGERWTVGAAATRVVLGEGVWLLTAVENEGLKIVALDDGTLRLPDPEAVPREARLRAGEVIFARPGGRGFGPVVTILLDELLASSRLVARFKEPLPRMERLRQQGEAQRERLRLVSNVHVGGATDGDAFQLVVPGKPAVAGKPSK